MEEFPQIVFVSTGVKQTGATSLEDALAGDLTIKGVTNSVTVPFDFEGGATDPFGNQRIGFEGALSISAARTTASPGTPHSRPAACWSATRSCSQLEVSAIRNA